MYSSIDELLIAWINDLKFAFPEFQDPLDKLEPSTLHEYLKTTFTKYQEHLAIMNEEIFKTEDPVFLLPHVSFRDIWALSSDTTKQAIWKYIMLIVAWTMLGDLIFKSFDNIEDVSSSDFWENTFKGFMEDNIPQELLEGKIGLLAKEIASKITPQELGFSEDTPSINIIKEILGKKEEVVGKLVQIVKDTIEQKIANGELSKEELVQEIKKLQGVFNKFLGMDNPNNRASMDPRRQKILERLKKKRASKK